MSERDALTEEEKTILREVLDALRRVRSANLARAFAIEVDVRGRQVEVRIRAHVRGFMLN